jgi:polyisoprenoid-binding protein YceI
MKRVPLALLALFLSAATALAQQPPPRPAQPSIGATTWLVDTAHSAAGFSVRHMMVATVRGVLGPISGTVEYDGSNVNSVKADVTIDLKGINTGNASRDNDLRGNEFFDVEKHPKVTFRSKRAEAAAAGRFRLVGDLTIRGVTREVTLDVEGPSPAVKTQNGGLKIGATATTKLNRRDFGLNYNSLIEAGPVVGDEVTVTIDLELNRPKT